MPFRCVAFDCMGSYDSDLKDRKWRNLPNLSTFQPPNVSDGRFIAWVHGVCYSTDPSVSESTDWVMSKRGFKWQVFSLVFCRGSYDVPLDSWLSLKLENCTHCNVLLALPTPHISADVEWSPLLKFLLVLSIMFWKRILKWNPLRITWRREIKCSLPVTMHS